MTKKEKYKQAFDTLSASDNFSLEVDKMSILNRKHKLKTIAAAVAACLIVTAGTGTAYASDLGGIQRKVQLWIDGGQTTATLKISSDGSYNGTYADKDGKQKEFGGGGVAFNPDGSERSLTEEEIMEELNAPDTTYSAEPYPPQSSTPGLSIAGMICGILSLLTCCFYYIGLPLAVLGLIFSIIGMKRNANGKGMAVAGIVTSAITLAIIVIMLIIVLVAANSSPYFYYEFENWLESLY